MAAVGLAFIARQLQHLINDVGALKDDMTVLMARLDRIDGSTRAAGDRIEITSHGVLDELRAMDRRRDRLAGRTDWLEDANREVPS